jgi:glucokinase
MYIGVDVGGTKILAALVDKAGKIHATQKIKTNPQDGEKAVLDKIIEVIKSLISNSRSKVLGVGLGLPGAIDYKTGTVLKAPNLGWKNLKLRAVLEKEFKLPIVLDNDVNVGLLGEWWLGAGKKYNSGVGLFWGTGIGGAVIIENELVHGLHGIAGEIGHMSLSLEGPQCNCGKKGCLEAYAGKVSISRDLKEAKIEFPNNVVKSSFLAKEYSSNKVVKDIVKKTVEYVGKGVGNLVNVLDPDVVILGGGVIESMGEVLLSRIQKSAAERAFVKPNLVLSKLGDNAGILGAAKLAMEK